MESEERALPEQELDATKVQSAAVGQEAPEAAAPAKQGEDFAPAQPQMPGETLARFALERELARGRQLLGQEMRIIQAVDPAVKSLADVRGQPEFERFDKLVEGGMAVSDAYKLACFDRLSRQQAAAARQAAINDVRAKEHLAPVGGGQAAEDGLTDEIIRNYRQYNPRWTRAQIAAFHRSYKQGV